MKLMLLTPLPNSDQWRDQGGPPLPASLQGIRLESDGNIDLEKLARGDGRLMAAAGTALVVSAAVVECKQKWILDDSVDNPSRLVSKLPDGFDVLELHTHCVSIKIVNDLVVPAFREGAAHWLCMLFAAAPASYQRFSLSWTHDRPLRIPVAGMSSSRTSESRNCEVGELAFDDAEELAGYMQKCAAYHEVNVAVEKDPAVSRIVMVRR